MTPEAAAAPPTIDAVRLEEVGFAYPDGTRALNGVNLTIAPGERVAIAGENGSGKSTLVRLLNGLLRPTEGRVLVFGRDAAGVHVAELARTVGLAFQNPDRQIFAGSVQAEVAFGPRNLGRTRVELDRVVASALASVGLAGEAQTNPYDLGYSRRKLLALASVVAMETPVVVVDEPTTGQDAPGIRRIAQVIDQLSSDGRTVIAISHDMRFVAENFERVVVMGDGHVLLDASPSEVFAEAAWPVLESTSLAPTYPALRGARLGLGSTPTDATYVEALAARQARSSDRSPASEDD
jgi:energy-coupling factor transport system ATP-binding protein